jgi:hypothetical protein
LRIPLYKGAWRCIGYARPRRGECATEPSSNFFSNRRTEAGRQQLAVATARQATLPEIGGLGSVVPALKEVVADLTVDNRPLKKSVIGGEPVWRHGRSGWRPAPASRCATSGAVQVTAERSRR